MTIDELIAKLQELRQEYGNLSVFIRDYEWGDKADGTAIVHCKAERIERSWEDLAGRPPDRIVLCGALE